MTQHPNSSGYWPKIDSANGPCTAQYFVICWHGVFADFCRGVAKLECGLFDIKHVSNIGHYGAWCEYSMGLCRAV